MSNSTVLVIGEDPEAMLAPYDENLEVEPYRRYEEGEAEDHWWVRSVRRGAEHHRNGTGLALEDRRSVFAGHPPRTVDEQRAEYAEAAEWSAKLGERATWETLIKLYNEKYPDSDEGLAYDPETDRAYTISTYNPLSKWDWYLLGGRWTGFYRLKPGAQGVVGEPGVMTGPADPFYVDQARNRDIDWEGMRDDAGKRAVEEHERVRRALDGIEPIVRWSVVRDERFPGRIDEARQWYHAQPGVRALAVAKLYADDPVEYWQLDHEDAAERFIARQRAEAGLTFAVLNADGWHERGRMGWFGIVSDEVDDWPETAAALMDAAPDDALFSVYDVHI